MKDKKKESKKEDAHKKHEKHLMEKPKAMKAKIKKKKDCP